MATENEIKSIWENIFEKYPSFVKSFIAINDESNYVIAMVKAVTFNITNIAKYNTEAEDHSEFKQEPYGSDKDKIKDIWMDMYSKYPLLVNDITTMYKYSDTYIFLGFIQNFIDNYIEFDKSFNV